MRSLLFFVAIACIIACGGSPPPVAPTPVPVVEPAKPAKPEHQPPAACTAKPSDPKGCLEAYEQECAANDFDACGELGTIHDEGESFERASELYSKACEGGIMGYCNNLARLYKYGRGVEKDLAKAHVLFQRGCDGKDMLSCSNRGVLFEGGLGVPKDYWRAKELYTQACEGGEMKGCYNLGVLYQDGHGVPIDPAKSQTYFKRACDGGLKEACDGAK